MLVHSKSAAHRQAGADPHQTTPRQSRDYLEAIGREAVAAIKPTRIDAYLDQMQFRLMDTLDDRQRDKIGSRTNTRLYVAKDKNGDPKPPLLVRGKWYQQCLHADQPTVDFVEAMAEFYPFLNQIECAYDLIFASMHDLIRAEETFARYAIKKYSAGQFTHYATTKGKREPQHLDKGLVTRYVADRRAWDALTHVQYSRLPKLDPDASQFALHLEFVISGAQPLQRINVSTFADLLTLDRRAFLQKVLLLADIDRAALARCWLNRLAGHRRYCADPVGVGGVLYRAAQVLLDPKTQERRHFLHPFSGSPNTQNVIAKYSKEDGKPFLPVVARCLIKFSIDHLLPSPDTFLRELGHTY